MTGKIKHQRAVWRLRETTRGFTHFAMLMQAYTRGYNAGMRAERKRLKEEMRRLREYNQELNKQLEPFRPTYGGGVLSPEDVTRREMWRAESNFQQRIKR